MEASCVLLIILKPQNHSWFLFVCFLSQHLKLGLPNKPPVCSLFSVCTWMFCPNHHLCPLLKRESEKRKKKERKWSCSVISDPFVTPWAVACQELLSMEFSSLESWRGLPGPFLVPPMIPSILSSHSSWRNLLKEH